jgi:hypothetical protein
MIEAINILEDLLYQPACCLMMSLSAGSAQITSAIWISVVLPARELVSDLLQLPFAREQCLQVMSYDAAGSRKFQHRRDMLRERHPA